MECINNLLMVNRPWGINCTRTGVHLVVLEHCLLHFLCSSICFLSKLANLTVLFSIGVQLT